MINLIAMLAQTVLTKNEYNSIWWYWKLENISSAPSGKYLLLFMFIN